MPSSVLSSQKVYTYQISGEVLHLLDFNYRLCLCLCLALLVKNWSKMTKIQRPPEKKWRERIFMFL